MVDSDSIKSPPNPRPALGFGAETTDEMKTKRKYQKQKREKKGGLGIQHRPISSKASARFNKFPLALQLGINTNSKTMSTSVAWQKCNAAHLPDQPSPLREDQPRGPASRLCAGLLRFPRHKRSLRSCVVFAVSGVTMAASPSLVLCEVGPHAPRRVGLVRLGVLVACVGGWLDKSSAQCRDGVFSFGRRWYQIFRYRWG